MLTYLNRQICFCASAQWGSISILVLSEGHGWFRLTLRRSTQHNVTSQWLFLLFSSIEQVNTWKWIFTWKMNNILLLACTRSSFKLPPLLTAYMCMCKIVCWHLSLPHSTRTATFLPEKTLQAVILTLLCTLVKTARSVLQSHVRNHHAEPCRTAVDNLFYSVLIVHTCSLSLQPVGMAQPSSRQSLVDLRTIKVWPEKGDCPAGKRLSK